jgi:uncharacterized protein
VQVRYNDVRSKKLPAAFDGFTLLHISDFHAYMNDGAMRRLEEILPDVSYDFEYARTFFHCAGVVTGTRM